MNAMDSREFEVVRRLHAWFRRDEGDGDGGDGDGGVHAAEDSGTQERDPGGVSGAVSVVHEVGADEDGGGGDGEDRRGDESVRPEPRGTERGGDATESSAILWFFVRSQRAEGELNEPERDHGDR